MIHTSDVHVGAPFEFLGLKGEEQRRTILETFESIISLAVKDGYSLLVVAGDLFDSAYSVAESDLSFVLRCLGEAGPGCSVILLPGSHDYWSPGAVYERERSRFEGCGNVTVLSPARRTAGFPDLSVAVHGNPLTSPSWDERPMAGLEPSGDFTWNIAVAHGSVEGASAAADSVELPICAAELGSGFDYVALGHWHSYNEIRPGAVYSGSPELIARDQKGAGSVASVTLCEGAVKVERIPVGRRRIEVVEADCTGLRTTEELVARIERTVPKNEDLVLELSLRGMLEADTAVDIRLALRELERSYFSVRSSGEPVTRRMPQEELLQIPEETVAGKFVRIMMERIERAEGEERETLEEALQVGYQLFKGRNPLG